VVARLPPPVLNSIANPEPASALREGGK